MRQSANTQVTLMRGHNQQSSTISLARSAAALTFFQSLKTFRLTFLRMRNKCKIINVQRNNKAFSV
jgi:hypothetical protein